MKRVLIVSPNFPPIAYPDMQRVRMALPFFGACGWEALVLKIDPAEQVGIKDPLLSDTVPPDVRVFQAGRIPIAFTSWASVRSIGLRSFFHIAALGSRIIEVERPQLIFFSTTMFPLFVLGPYWLKKHRCPYVLDFQDPWVCDELSTGGRDKRSGKRLASNWMAKILEPLAVRAAAHILCVSPAYPSMIRRRYPDVETDRFSVLPFGAAESDFEIVDSHKVHQTVFSPEDGCRHWVYVGRGGLDMAFTLRSLFGALRHARDAAPESVCKLRLHFVGTDYAGGTEAKKTVEPIANEYGVGDLVVEQTERIPYFEALKCLCDADALIVLGSDDSGYTASKIYPYILAKKPMLAIFHEKSSVVQVLVATQAGTVITFNGEDTSDRISATIFERWFRADWKAIPSTKWSEFQQYTAQNMTAQLCTRFDEVISAQGVAQC